jgi:hypothetical protein
MSVPAPVSRIGVAMTGSPDGPSWGHFLCPDARAAPADARYDTDWWIHFSPRRSLPNDIDGVDHFT